MKASGKEQTYYALVLFPGVVVILILKIFYSIWLWMVQREPILMAKSHGGASLKPAGGMADAVIRIGSRGRCITRHQLCSPGRQNAARLCQWPGRAAADLGGFLLSPWATAPGSGEGIRLLCAQSHPKLDPLPLGSGMSFIPWLQEVTLCPLCCATC